MATYANTVKSTVNLGSAVHTGWFLLPIDITVLAIVMTSFGQEKLQNKIARLSTLAYRDIACGDYTQDFG